MRLYTFASIFACAVAMIMATGCQSTYVPAKDKDGGTYELKPGIVHYTVDLREPVEEVHAAAVKGFKDLEIEPVKQDVDKLSGVVSGVLADGKEIKVELSANVEGGTNMKIKVGNVANKAKSLAVFKAVKKHL